VILHPAILSLLLGSAVVAGVLLYAAGHAVRILRHWDIRSGSERQLALERRTYLLTTIVTWTLVFQAASLLLYVHVADDLATLFVGAMCAAGSLALNGFGYPALGLKVLNFLLAGTWLIVNAADNRARDYPLVRFKYGMLLVLTPCVLGEAALQGAYFLSLRPDIITSCCGSLFTKGTESLAASLFVLPQEPSLWAFGLSMALTGATGIWFLARRGPVSGYLYAGSGTVTLGVSLVTFVSSLCLYFYELPSHHCPFCVFQREYGQVGYPLYTFLLAGATLVLGLGILMPFRQVPSLGSVIPTLQRRLALLSLGAYGAYTALVLFRVATSNLRL